MDDDQPSFADYLTELIGIMCEIRDDQRAIRNHLETRE
jgi:hypothetical protein